MFFYLVCFGPYLFGFIGSHLPDNFFTNRTQYITKKTITVSI